MELKELNRLIEDLSALNRKIWMYEKKEVIKKQKPEKNEILGHIEKAEHNLKFVQDNLKLGHLDWCITGCYYSVYQASLALILHKGYSSKSHDATLCTLIKEFYKRGIEKNEIELINMLFITYQDLLFYLNAKKKREEASYSSIYKFDSKEVEELRSNSILFVNKAKEIIGFKP